MNAHAFVSLVLQDAAALLIVKATLVLALASGAALAAKGFSAARRHTLWFVGLSSCVWLVLSSAVVPATVLHVPTLVQKAVEPAAPSTGIAIPKVLGVMRASPPRVRERAPGMAAVLPSPFQPAPLPTHPLIALWMIGCIVLFVRHAIGFVGTTRLARRAAIANDDGTSRALSGVIAAVGVRRKVRVGYSTDVRAPITFEIAKPYVLLPTEARSWSIERRRAVLLHETAHIARGDWLSQAIGQLACDLFWFHPLVWFAFARLRDEAERAADDCVLRSGMPACEYATHLLELARGACDVRPDLVAIGIVSTNDLAQRFVAMFDAKRSRATVTSRARAVTTSVALAVLCPLASLRVGAPAHLMHAPPRHASLQHASLTQRSTPRPAHATPETSHSSSAVAEHPAPRPVVHPDLSGTWRQDTVAGPMVDFVVTDSAIIKQSTSNISLESHGHVLIAPTYDEFQTITFDGAESRGVTATGHVAANFIASAVWAGDTLVLTTRSMPAAHDVRSVERMSLSPDGNTLFTTISTFVDWKSRWGGPRTFVLRRVTP